MNRKHYTTIVISLVAVILTSCTNTVNEDNTDFHNNPVEASQVLLSSFQINGNGDYIYPDDYAGEWIDGSYLYIALTDSSKRNIREYEKLLDGYNCIEFVVLDYSLNHLNVIKNSAAEILNINCKVESYYVDFKQNKIVFEVISSHCERAKSILFEQLKMDLPFGLEKSIEVNEDMFLVEEYDSTVVIDAIEANGDFLNLISKQITVVNADESFAYQIDVDADWLKKQLGESELCESPSAILALSFRMVISYEDGTKAVLRLLNHYDGACVLDYNGDSYCFKNETIAEWFLKTSDGDNIVPMEIGPLQIGDEFSELTHKQISKVSINLPTCTVETGIDIEWLERQLSFAEKREISAKGDKADWSIDIVYEDNTEAELLIYDIESAYFLLRYNNDVFYFRNEELMMWVLDIKNNCK